MGSPGSPKTVHWAPLGRRLVGKEEVVEHDGLSQAQARVYGSHDGRGEHRPGPELFQGDDVGLVGDRMGQVPVVLLVAGDTPDDPLTSLEDRNLHFPETALDDARLPA